MCVCAAAAAAAFVQTEQFPVSIDSELTELCIVAKTRSQLNRRLAEGQKLPWPPFGKQWYAGCTTLIIGNSAKAAIPC